VKARHIVAMLVIPAGALGLGATAAFAVPGASTSPPVPEVVGTGGSSPQVLPSSQVVATTAAPSQSLPLTGGDVAGLTVIGVALVGGGAVLVRRTRAKASD
jgi:LPXTG-motif cell wall-anchored protein